MSGVPRWLWAGLVVLLAVVAASPIAVTVYSFDNVLDAARPSAESLSLPDDADEFHATAHPQAARKLVGLRLNTGAEVHLRRTPVLVAPSGLADDFVVLGKSDGLAAQADKLGGRHLMGSADWQADVLSTIANPNSRIAVALDGLEGAGSVSSRIRAGVQRGASGAGSPFDWELAQLYQSGRLSTTELFENGVAISNPFG